MVGVDYALKTLDPGDESDATETARAGWLQAVARGFHEARPSQAWRTAWRDTVREDRQRLVGAWLPEGAYAAGPVPVATFSSWDMTLNTGAGLLPVHMISDVTVSPAHRRRGLLRRMMTADLAATDAPLAALTVTEGSIYGRFGFGPAILHRSLEVDTSSRFAFRDFLDPGRVEVVEPADLWDTISAVFDRFHQTTRGSLARPHSYQAWLTGRVDPMTGNPDDRLRGAVHLDAGGAPDGYVLYKHAEGEGDRPATITADLLAHATSAHLGLWRFLADIDLSERVVVRSGPLGDPLEWALVNRDVVRVTGVSDHIWLRVLDVPLALEARRWYADGSLVVAVDDPLGHAAGTVEVTVVDGCARVRPNDAEAQVSLSAETLSALYLGGVGVATLARAGRIGGSEEAVARFAAMADGGPSPYSASSF